MKSQPEDFVRVTVRMSPQLHDALWSRRAETGHSLNDLLNEAVANFLGLPAPTPQKGVPGPKSRRGGSRG